MIGRALLVLLAGAGTGLLLASGTTTWEMNTYQDFVKGRFAGVSLSRDGRLLLAPKLETLFSSDQPAVWAVAPANDGSFYVGTGHRGRVYRVTADGKNSLVWSSEQPEIFALAVDKAGVLYAGTSPDGRVYRVKNGQAELYFDPKEKYIWSMVFGQDGALYVGTGAQGKVFRVTGQNQGEVYYETGQANITALAVDPQGRLLAGTEPNGILYRITAKDKAFVLYDSSLPEIRSIVPQADGRVYVAALGGSIAKRVSAISSSTIATSNTSAVSSPGVSITVTDAPSNPIDPKPKAAEQTRQQTTTSVTPMISSSYSAPVDVSGVEKSAVYRINPDNTVETLWNSKEENVYDLLMSGQQVFFSTDAQGRIYRLTNDRQVTLFAQTNEGEATRLLQSGPALVAATSTLGKLYRMEANTGVSGFYEAPVHDANTVAKWGALSWRTDGAAQGSVMFRTRSGNSARPDKTWSDWSAPLAGKERAVVTSPNARYIQWRLEFAGVNGRAPVVDNVTLSYLPQNNPPVVKSITVTGYASATSAGKSAASVGTAATSSVYSITVTDSGDTSTAATASAGTPAQTLNRGMTSQMLISWQADDPDSDKLAYTVWYKGEDEGQWKLLRTNMTETSLTLDSDVLADGKYFFRVQASDRPSNPPDVSREGELQSAPVLIDNTPPTVTARLVRRAGAQAEVEATGQDAASALRRCEYSLDASGWTPVSSVDGVIDSPQEQFRLALSGLTPGEHVVVLRVYDSAGNVGLAKVVIH